MDHDEAFSSVVKFATVRAVLSLAPVLGLDGPSAQYQESFLHDTLTETVYYNQSTGSVDSTRPDLVCRLNRSLYGLKQVPWAWYSRFTSYLASLGFIKAKLDTSLFIYRRDDNTVYLLLYVDDIMVTTSIVDLLQRTIDAKP